MALALMAGVTAGFVAWIAGEWAHDLFRPRLVAAPRWEAIWMEPTADTLYVADLKNAALTNAVLGCVTGLAMGLAGGIVARAPSRGILVGLFAQAGGSLVAACAGLALFLLCLPASPRPFRTITTDVWLPIAIHSGVWGAVGIVGGAAFAIGARRTTRLREAVAFATAGALLAAVLFQLIGICLPLDAGAANPVASWPVVRLAAMLVPIFLIAAGSALGTNGDEHPSVPSH